MNRTVAYLAGGAAILAGLLWYGRSSASPSTRHANTIGGRYAARTGDPGDRTYRVFFQVLSPDGKTLLGDHLAGIAELPYSSAHLVYSGPLPEDSASFLEAYGPASVLKADPQFEADMNQVVMAFLADHPEVYLS